MVVVRNNEVTSIALEESAGKLKTVDPNASIVEKKAAPGRAEHSRPWGGGPARLLEPLYDGESAPYVSDVRPSTW